MSQAHTHVHTLQTPHSTLFFSPDKITFRQRRGEGFNVYLLTAQCVLVHLLGGSCKLKAPAQGPAKVFAHPSCIKEDQEERKGESFLFFLPSFLSLTHLHSPAGPVTHPLIYSLTRLKCPVSSVEAEGKK